MCVCVGGGGGGEGICEGRGTGALVLYNLFLFIRTRYVCMYRCIHNAHTCSFHESVMT